MEKRQRTSGLTTIEMVIVQANNTDVRRQIPPGTGRVYHVRTTVGVPDPARLELTAIVTWQLASGRPAPQDRTAPAQARR